MSRLVVDNLSVTFRGTGRAVHAVCGLSYELQAGRTLGIVGESGCGKSTSALAVLGLNDRRAEVTGSIRLDGTEIVGAPAAQVRALRGSSVAMVFQNPQSALHPMKTIGTQIAEAYRVHHPRTSRAVALKRAAEMLDRVGIAAAARRVRDYPHEFSGGMRQRAMIAMALINDPSFLIADEPTTALDVTVQAQILDLLDELKDERGLGIVLITHDVGVVSTVADDVLVMYAGRCVEFGPTRDVLDDPRMPYTAELLASLPSRAEPDALLPAIPGSPPDPSRLPSGCAFHPRCPHIDLVPGGRCHTALPELVGSEPGRLSRCHLRSLPARRTSVIITAREPRTGAPSDEPVLDVEHLTKDFALRGAGVLPGARKRVRVVDDVSLAVHRGSSIGLVGETGCGKTTVARLIVRLLDATSGTIRYAGTDLATMSQADLRPVRKDLQMIFQDPVSSLNGRHTAHTIIGTPLRVHAIVPGAGVRNRVRELMEVVGLNPDHADRYPHEFSSGQRQRIGIARALAVEPKIIVADEPVSSLDVSVQAQILNLLSRLQAEFGIGYLFIAHDLTVVRQFCQDVSVMYLGKVVETGGRDAVYGRPAHPYTKALLAAVPDVAAPRRGERAVLSGEPPDPAAVPSGCRFRARCPIAQNVCAQVEPPLVEVAPGQRVACHFPAVGAAAR